MCVHCLNTMHVYSAFNEQILLKAYYMPGSVLYVEVRGTTKRQCPSSWGLHSIKKGREEVKNKYATYQMIIS